MTKHEVLKFRIDAVAAISRMMIGALEAKDFKRLLELSIEAHRAADRIGDGALERIHAEERADGNEG